MLIVIITTAMGGAKAKTKTASSKPKAQASAKSASSKAKTTIAKEKAAHGAENSKASSSNGVKGKSIYGLARDPYKANYDGAKQWDNAWKESKQCQDVLSKMSHASSVDWITCPKAIE